MISQKVENLVADLSVVHDDLLATCMDVLNAENGTLYPLDLLAMASVNRTLSQIEGLSYLVRNRNFICAAPLVRMQLDTALRFFAAWQVSKPHDFSMEVIGGVEVRKQKDRNGNKMTDAHLVDLLAREFPWVTKVYREGSGFVHLSEKHVFAVFKDFDGEDRFKIQLSPKNDFPEDSYIELVSAFKAATDVLLHYLRGWKMTKMSGGKSVKK